MNLFRILRPLTALIFTQVKPELFSQPKSFTTNPFFPFCPAIVAMNPFQNALLDPLVSEAKVLKNFVSDEEIH